MTTKRKIELQELYNLGFTEKASKVYSNSDQKVIEIREELEIEDGTALYNTKYCIQIGSDIVYSTSKFKDIVEVFEDY